MAETKKKNERFLTGKGIAVFPRLESPDTKFKPEGQFTVKLRQDSDVGEALKNKIIKAANSELARYTAELTEKARDIDVDVSKKAKMALKKVKLADLPYAEDDDTGDVTFSFKMTASGVSKKTGKPWTMQPAIFDAKGVVLKNIPKIGAGSELNVSYEFNVFSSPIGCGVSLRLVAVQVLKLVEWVAGGNAKSYGFGTTDGDYEAGDAEFAATPEPAPEKEAETETDSDSADF